jgi:hypothetical protein
MKTKQSWKESRTLRRLRESNRDFTVGQPPMFSPLQRACRRISGSTVWQLRRWARTWPKKARQLMKAHEAFLALHGEKEKSPFIDAILVVLGCVEFIKAEIASRIANKPNTFDFSKYELDTVLA